MGYGGYILWKAGAAWDQFTWWWPVAAFLVALGLVGAVLGRPHLRKCIRPRTLLQLSPLILSSLILVAAVFGENLKPWPPGHLVRWAELSIYALLFLHAVAGIALTIFARQCRLVAGSVQAVLLWWALCAAKVAWMQGPFL